MNFLQLYYPWHVLLARGGKSLPWLIWLNINYYDIRYVLP